MARQTLRYSSCVLLKSAIICIAVIPGVAESVYVTKYVSEPKVSDLYTAEGYLKRISADMIECAVQCTNTQLCASFFYSKSHFFCSLHSMDFPMPTARTHVQFHTKHYRNHCSTLGYKFSNVTGVFYKIFPSKGTGWDEARRFCEHKGGRLVVLDSTEKVDDFWNILKDEIFSRGKGMGDHGFWVGAVKDSSDNNFYWVNGEQVTEGWSTGEPRRENTDCVLMNPYLNGRLDDFSCEYDKSLHPICECPRH